VINFNLTSLFKEVFWMSNENPDFNAYHGQDSRYTGSHTVSPTISADWGSGGNNTALAIDHPDAYCISGTAIDRQPHNGGNGLGIQREIAPSLTTCDRPAVLPAACQETVGTLCGGDEKGIGNQYVSQDKCIVSIGNLVRRLTPLECERLQGFPDGWTNIPDASDSARYRALGNSVAIPCVEYIMMGIAEVYAAGL
jgi:DNA (cytosine-5)-methyltransferase 1